MASLGVVVAKGPETGDLATLPVVRVIVAVAVPGGTAPAFSRSRRVPVGGRQRRVSIRTP